MHCFGLVIHHDPCFLKKLHLPKTCLSIFLSFGVDDHPGWFFTLCFFWGWFSDLDWETTFQFRDGGLSFPKHFSKNSWPWSWMDWWNQDCSCKWRFKLELGFPAPQKCFIIHIVLAMSLLMGGGASPKWSCKHFCRNHRFLNSQLLKFHMHIAYRTYNWLRLTILLSLFAWRAVSWWILERPGKQWRKTTTPRPDKMGPSLDTRVGTGYFHLGGKCRSTAGEKLTTPRPKV